MPLEPKELLVDVNAMPWKEVGDGAWAKVLRVCSETGTWTALFKQAAGTFVPPHKHLGPADLYVLSGCIDYRGGVAKAGYFGREPLGAVHEKTSFPEETVYLFTAYGPVAFYGDDGQVVFVNDADSMQTLLES